MSSGHFPLARRRAGGGFLGVINKAKRPCGRLGLSALPAASPVGQLPAVQAPNLANWLRLCWSGISAVSRAHLAGWGRVPVASLYWCATTSPCCLACTDMRPLPNQWLPTAEESSVVDLRD